MGIVVRCGCETSVPVPKLCCGALGIRLFLDEGGHGLAEGVGGDPHEVGVRAGLAPLTADVVGRQPGVTSGGEDRVMGLSAATSLRARIMPTANWGRTTIR
jgi:hypothetical protein